MEGLEMIPAATASSCLLRTLKKLKILRLKIKNQIEKY